MPSNNLSVRLGAALACVTYLGLTACSGTDNELARFIDDIRRQPAGPVKPLPEIKPAKSFSYNAYDLRSPFMPSSAGGGRLSGPRPDQNRNREFLEQYSLDTLRMVGTLRLGGQIICGLVETKDGLVHRVTIGNHLGQAGGVITKPNPSTGNADRPLSASAASASPHQGARRY